MLLTIIAFILLILLLLLYFRIADHFNIIDKPNHRSSHSKITIRGGGIIFPVAALLWFILFGFGQPWIILALMLMAVISFLDDIITLPAIIRITVHFTAVTLLFWQLHVLGLPWVGIALAYIFTIGWINAFNFMDGINGITAFYSLVALATFGWLSHTIVFVSPELITVLILSVLVFSFFNARKRAKAFAGDVGSVSMAFLLAWLMIALMIKTGRIEYILLFVVYGIDSVVTIIFRLIRRENIFKAHRSHLYQYLSNELKMPHVLVSVIYALVQLLINVSTIVLIQKGMMSWGIFVIILLVITSMYVLVRILVWQNISHKLTAK